MHDYLRRVVDQELDELVPALAAILLDGPKGVGKTRTALRRCATARRLDIPAQFQILSADDTTALRGDKPILIDEWQRIPALWDAIRRQVDDDRSGGQFILTGSAPPPNVVIHSGAGRIATLRMRPLTLPERGVAIPTVSLTGLVSGLVSGLNGTSPLTLVDYTQEIVSSGFPGIRPLTDRAQRLQLTGYIERIVDHDLAETGYAVRRPAAVRAWLAAYAAATATTASYEKIRDAATGHEANKPARTTTLAYIELLKNLRILDPIPAWLPSNNHLKLLTQGEKHHLADPALAACILGLDVSKLLDGESGPVVTPRDGAFLGALFESLATLSVRTFAQACDCHVAHLRTQDNRRDVDLIIERRDGRVVAAEVKLSSQVVDADVRHLLWLREQIGPRLIDSVILTTGPEAYRRSDGIAVVPLALLGP